MYRLVKFNDLLSWFQFGQGTNYRYFQISSTVGSKLHSYGREIIYGDWFTLDEMEDQITRTSNSIWDICGNVGGI